MGLYPDLDDVAAESPVAVKELAELRTRVKELEEERRQVGVWVELAARALRGEER